MKRQKEKEFSWVGLFMITAISFCLFSLFLKMIDGSPTHSALFFKIGIGSLVCWFFVYISKTVRKPVEKKEG
jgi:hypothetical protein